MHGHDSHNTTILSIIHVSYMFRPIIFLTVIRWDTIVGKNYTMYMILFTPTLMVILYHIMYCAFFTDNCIQPDDGQK